MIRLYRKIAATQSYWLVPLGILFFLIGLPITVYSGADEIFPARNFSIGLPWLVIFGVFLAPVIEEISFRGFFTSRPWIRIVAFLLLTAFVILGSKNWLNYSAYVVFILFTLLSLKRKSPGILFLKFFSNAFLFGIIHWEISDVTIFFASFIQIGVGLVLIWIVLNFGIIRAMLFHGAYNFLIMAVLLFTLQFPDERQFSRETEAYRLEWNRVPYFNDAPTVLKLSNKGIVSRSLSAKRTYSIISAANQGEDLRKVVILEPYMKYNIKLTFKDPVPDSEIIDALIAELDSAGLWTVAKRSEGTAINK